MGDPIPTPFDILGEWFELSDKTGKAREEAISRIEEFLMKKKRNRMRRASTIS